MIQSSEIDSTFGRKMIELLTLIRSYGKTRKDQLFLNNLFVQQLASSLRGKDAKLRTGLLAKQCHGRRPDTLVYKLTTFNNQSKSEAQ